MVPSLGFNIQTKHLTVAKSFLRLLVSYISIPADVPPPSSVPSSAPGPQIIQAHLYEWGRGRAKLMGALLSKAPPHLFALINSMWRSVEGTV